MVYSKLIGWIVFFIGLLVIIATLFNSYNIFTGSSEIPIYFHSQAQSLGESSSGDLQEQIQALAREELKNMVPEGAITTMFNLAVWSVFAFIFIFGGFQIGSLGVKLIKKQ